MHFLPDVYVPCEVCKAGATTARPSKCAIKESRFADVLDLTVADAARLFEHQPRIRTKTRVAQRRRSGIHPSRQSATTLSGGEAQRVKLATELSKRDTGRTLYILDEPTTGLHFEMCGCCWKCCTDWWTRKYGRRYRAQSRRRENGRLGHRPRPRGRRVGRPRRRGRAARESRAVEGHHTGQFLRKVLQAGD